MDGEIEISCVVPAYESVSLLARCLLSILTQAGVTPQIIVVDDSRTGEVGEFVRRLRGVYPGIGYFEGARTGNPVDNWNAGLARAGGKYCVLAHHDDFFISDSYLRRAVDQLEAHGGGVLVVGHGLAGIGGQSRFGMAASLARRLKLPPWTLYLFNWIGPTAAVVFATEGAARFDARLCWLADVDFYRRLLAPALKLIRDDEVRVISVRHQGQITARIDRDQLALDELRLLAHDAAPPIGRWQFVVAIAYAMARLYPRRWLAGRFRPPGPPPAFGAAGSPTAPVPPP